MSAPRVRLIQRLRAACETGNAAQAARLLAGGLSPDEPLDPMGTTPLMAAGSLALFDLLLAVGASPAASRFGRDTLQVVVSGEESALPDRATRLVAARRIIGRGVPLELRNAHGWSRVYVAAFAGDADAVDALLELGAPADDEPPPLAAACWGSGTDATARIVDLLVSAGADLRRRDEAGWSLLHAAAMPYSHGNGFESSDGPSLAAILALVGHGLGPDLDGPGGVTPLMLVADDGDRPAVDALLAAGAEPSRRDAQGLRAVDHARRTEQSMAALLPQPDPAAHQAVARRRDAARACAELLDRAARRGR